VSKESTLLAVIPARGGSKGLPGKNIRSFAGIPLIAHTILFAKLCGEIARCIVSTDSPDIAEVARKYGGDVPFIRPPELGRDDAPLWLVLRHALAAVEAQERIQYDTLLLLDPTSPARQPSDITGALIRLQQSPEADGIIGVSRPEFNPVWHCVVEQNGWMRDLMEGAGRFEHRQETPTVFRINGSLYIWRARFVSDEERSWRNFGRHLIYEIPESRAMSIDSLEQFERAELLVTSGVIRFPWLDRARL
jgi:N-acylneuraminate cytidylyltransferase